MTDKEARDRVTTMRNGLRRAMRHLSGPEPDWMAASGALLCVSASARRLSDDCYMEEVEHGKTDR